MKTYRATCVLADGMRVSLTVIAATAWDVLDIAIETYGAALIFCSPGRAR